MTSLDLELIVGTYTERLPHVDGHADGILGLTIGANGSVGPSRTLTGARNPSWVTVGRDGRLVVAVLETEEFDGSPTGGVVSLRRDPVSGDLEPLSSRPSAGGSPAFVALDPTESFAIVANYGGGSVAVLPVDADGRLGDATDVVRHEGSGPRSGRQDAPHPHQVLVDPLTGEVLIVDLGADAIVRYRSRDGHLQRVGAVRTPPGSGPRHGAFSADGASLFVVGELDGSVLAFRRSADGFVLHDAVSLGPGAQPAAIRRHESGALLVSSRGIDEIAVIRADGGALAVAGGLPAHGRTPRDFLVVGDRVVVANQDSSDIAVLHVDIEAGTTELVATAPVPSPVCLALTGTRRSLGATPASQTIGRSASNSST